MLSCAVGEHSAVNDSILVSLDEANIFHLSSASTAVNEMRADRSQAAVLPAMDTILQKMPKVNLCILNAKRYPLNANSDWLILSVKVSQKNRCNRSAVIENVKQNHHNTWKFMRLAKEEMLSSLPLIFMNVTEGELTLKQTT